MSERYDLSAAISDLDEVRKAMCAANEEIERLREALRECRAAALEEAAKLVDVFGLKEDGPPGRPDPEEIAAAIRKLKERGDE